MVGRVCRACGDTMRAAVSGLAVSNTCPDRRAIGRHRMEGVCALTSGIDDIGRDRTCSVRATSRAKLGGSGCGL